MVKDSNKKIFKNLNYYFLAMKISLFKSVETVCLYRTSPKACLANSKSASSTNLKKTQANKARQWYCLQVAAYDCNNLTWNYLKQWLHAKFAK